MITRMVSFQGKVVSHARDKLYSHVNNILTGIEDSEFCDMTTDGRLLFIAPSSKSNEVMRVYDGITMRTTFAVVDKNGYLLRPALVCIHRNILFAARTKEMNEAGGEEVIENQLWWSNVGDLEDFDPWGSGNLDSNGVKSEFSFQNFEPVGDQGESIVRLISHSNNLYIFKRNSVWRVTGTTSPDGSLVGPESIIELPGKNGLVAPNAITDTGKSLIFLSDQGLSELVGDRISQVNGDVHEHLEKMDRRNWRNAVINYDKSKERLYVGVGDTRPVNDRLFVSTVGKAWFEWTLPSPASCIETLTKPQGETFTAIGCIDDSVGILDDNQRMDFGFYQIPSSYGTDWTDLGHRETKDIRSIELLMRVEGDFEVTLEVFHDMCRVPHETHTFRTRVPVPLTPVIGEVRVETGNTADREMFFPYTIDLNGRCRKIRFQLSCSGDNNRFQVARMTVGFLKTTKV